MIADLQIFSYEIGPFCDMSRAHPWCPSNDPSRYHNRAEQPPPLHVVRDFVAALMDRGFSGIVGMHYYCEPTLWMEKCAQFSDLIHALGLQTLCWTNGQRKIPGGVFDRICRTPYTEDGCGERVAYRPDHRLKIYNTDPRGNGLCYRPSILEMVANHYGDMRMCCADWKGTVSIGNIQDGNYDALMDRWEAIALGAEQCAHDVCRKCHALEVGPALIDRGYTL